MRFFALLPAAACLGLAGCGGPPLPPETDPAKGRETLTKVLDAWKRGGARDDVAPVVADDPDWAAGSKLTGYEFMPDERRFGVDWLVPVKLTLTKPDGKPQTKKVNFLVAIGADRTVVCRTD